MLCAVVFMSLRMDELEGKFDEPCRPFSAVGVLQGGFHQRGEKGCSSSGEALMQVKASAALREEG